mgnify:FL=1
MRGPKSVRITNGEAFLAGVPSPCVLLMAKPTPGAKRLPLSSPQHFKNASSPARTVGNLLASYPRAAQRRNGAESRPQGGPLDQLAGWLS